MPLFVTPDEAPPVSIRKEEPPKMETTKRAMLNPKYTFDGFVIEKATKWLMQQH